MTTEKVDGAQQGEAITKESIENIIRKALLQIKDLPLEQNSKDDQSIWLWERMMAGALLELLYCKKIPEEKREEADRIVKKVLGSGQTTPILTPEERNFIERLRTELIADF